MGAEFTTTDGCLEGSFSGILTEADLVRLCATVDGHTLTALLDFQKVTVFPPGSRVFEIQGRTAKVRVGRMALVAKDELAFGNLRMISQILDFEGDFEVFQKMGAARTWINAGGSRTVSRG